MAKISKLPALTEQEVDGTELTPVVKNGATRMAPIGYLGAHAAQAAALIRDQAADLVRPENIFYNVTLAAAEAEVLEGINFKIVDGETGITTVYRRTAVGSDLLYDEITGAGLAKPEGATRVGFAKSTVAQRLSGEWSVSDNLTKSQFADVQADVLGEDLTNSIQEMLSDGNVRSLTFPPGTYKVSGDATATECLLLERKINLIAPGGKHQTSIIGYMPGNSVGAVLRVRMAGEGDVRGWTMNGLKIYPEPSVGGKDGLVIADDGLPMLENFIEKCHFGRNPANGGMAAIFGFVWAHGFVLGNTLSGSVLGRCGDANLFQKNLSFGDPTEFAYIFDLVPGVRNNTVEANTITSQGGALHVINGQELRFKNNQCEQRAGPVNANPVKSLVWLEGRDPTRAITNTILEGDNLGGGTNYERSFYIDNARRTIISQNKLHAPGQDSIGGNADVYLTANAIDTIIKSDNDVEGTPFSPRTNRIAPVRTIDAGVGTVNSLRTDLNAVNGWRTAGILKTEDGRVRAVGDLVGGSTAPGDAIFTYPRGYRPARKHDAVRRNLLTSTVSLAAWTRSNVTTGKSAVLTPWASREFTLVAAAETNTAHLLRSPGTQLEAAVRCQGSFLIRRVTGLTVNIARFALYRNGFANYVHGLIDLTTGAISGVGTVGGGPAGVVTAAETSPESKTWRVNVDWTVPSADTYFLAVAPGNPSTVLAPFAGDPAVHQVLFLGPQIEAAAAPSAYQAVHADGTLETTMFDLTIPVRTSAGPGTVTVSQSGVVRVDNLPAPDIEAFEIQSEIVS